MCAIKVDWVCRRPHIEQSLVANACLPYGSQAQRVYWEFTHLRNVIGFSGEPVISSTCTLVEGVIAMFECRATIVTVMYCFILTAGDDAQIGVHQRCRNFEALARINTNQCLRTTAHLFIHSPLFAQSQ